MDPGAEGGGGEGETGEAAAAEGSDVGRDDKGEKARLTVEAGTGALRGTGREGATAQRVECDRIKDEEEDGFEEERGDADPDVDEQEERRETFVGGEGGGAWERGTGTGREPGID